MESIRDLNVYKVLQFPVVREALLYEKLANEQVRCGLCERRCVIPNAHKGFCNTRLNVEGKLYTLVYGDLSALESRPIEIKPFFHYWPGSTALTFSTWSCNFDCDWCQNFNLSKTRPNPHESQYYAPQEIVEKALKGGDDGLCASFQEPTILTDWLIPLFKIGSTKGLHCCCVSNGYMTLETLRLLKNAGMDALKIDIKGDAETYKKYCGGTNVEKVWRNVGEAKKMGLHIEVVNLIVTAVNDSEAALRWIIDSHLKNAGAETPLHFTRYYPAYKFNNPPTKIETLERAYEIARKAGVLYPYVGNVPGHRYEDTYCPNCKAKLIRRLSYKIRSYKVQTNGRCPKCGERIPIKGKYSEKEQSS